MIVARLAKAQNMHTLLRPRDQLATFFTISGYKSSSVLSPEHQSQFLWEGIKRSTSIMRTTLILGLFAVLMAAAANAEFQDQAQQEEDFDLGK